MSIIEVEIIQKFLFQEDEEDGFSSMGTQSTHFMTPVWIYFAFILLFLDYIEKSFYRTLMSAHAQNILTGGKQKHVILSKHAFSHPCRSKYFINDTLCSDQNVM